MKALTKLTRWLAAVALGCMLAFAVHAQGNLEVDSPAISALKASMQKRHAQLAPLYASGAIGFATDGSIALRDASLLPLAQRSTAGLFLNYAHEMLKLTASQINSNAFKYRIIN